MNAKGASASPAAQPPPFPLCLPSFPADLGFGNPLFASAMSPGGDGADLNPIYSPATGGGSRSAVGLRRLGFLPSSALGPGAQQPAAGAPGGLSVQEDGDWMEDDAGEQPPVVSLEGTALSPAGVAAAGLGSRERPEEEEFARVLGAGAGLVLISRAWLNFRWRPRAALPISGLGATRVCHLCVPGPARTRCACPSCLQ